LAQTEGLRKASDALQLFNEHDKDSPMDYESWQDAYHPVLGPELTRVAEAGAMLAKKQGVSPGDVPYLWADAISSSAFDYYHPRKAG
jgi:hypothetical protein